MFKTDIALEASNCILFKRHVVTSNCIPDIMAIQLTSSQFKQITFIYEQEARFALGESSTYRVDV